MEVNIVKKSLSRVSSRVAYVFPSIYKVMISGLAPDIIYTMLNNRDEIYAERFTCIRLRGQEDEPRSLETGSRLRDFPLIFTSIHYEPDIVNLVRLLISGGIEVFSKNRDRHVIIAGGPVCMENPIPYSDIIDAFIMGEAEATLDKVIESWLAYSDSKRKFLEELSNLNYVYVPEHSSCEVRREYVKDLNLSPYPVRQVEHTEIEPIYGRGFKLEVSRGCLFWCSFCIETRLFQPYRERNLITIKRILEDGSRFTISGKRVVLFSLVFPATEAHYLLLDHLANEGYKVTFPSLRITPYLEKTLDLIKTLGQRTLTLAPESFSPVLQGVISKYPSMLDYITQFIEETIERGFDLKLYLIYGFKGYEESDVRENIEYLSKIATVSKKKGGRLSVSLNPLVPKPHTPFQWIGMLKRDKLMSILRLYMSSLKGLVETRVYDIDWAIIQAQLALAPRPLGVFIKEWALEGGGLSGWRKTIRKTGFNYRYVFEGYHPDKPLPWDFIILNSSVEKVNKSQFLVYTKNTHISFKTGL